MYLSRSARRGAVVVLAALALTLSACSSPPAPEPGAGPGAPPAAGSLEFSGTTHDGTTLEAATLAGTPVVLWFWAPF